MVSKNKQKHNKTSADKKPKAAPQKAIETKAQTEKKLTTIRAGKSPERPSEERKNMQAQSVISRKEPNLLLQQPIAKASQFLNEVLVEFRKISWPERSQVIRETVSVLFLVALITLLVWSFDLLVGKFVFAPLEHLGKMYGIGGPSGMRLNL